MSDNMYFAMKFQLFREKLHSVTTSEQREEMLNRLHLRGVPAGVDLTIPQPFALEDDPEFN